MKTLTEQNNNTIKPLNQNKMTAVEWLYDKLLNAEPNILEWGKYLEQAKEMEKEQIKNAYKYGIQDEYVIGAEQYYNEQYDHTVTHEVPHNDVTLEEE